MTAVLVAPLFDPGAGRIDVEMPEGLTVAEMIGRALPDLPATDYAQCRISLVTGAGASVVDPLYFHVVRPRRGVQVVIRLVPAKAAMRSVLAIVVSVAAVALGGPLGGMLAGTFGGSAGAWTAAATLGINVLGSLLVNALIPPPQPREERPSYSISGWRNRFEPDGAVPVVLGQIRYAPPFAASSWTEIVGDHQYVRALFTFGYGAVQLQDMRLGDTPLSEFEEVETETLTAGQPGNALALFPRQVVEENVGVSLTRPKPRDDFGEITSHDGVETPVVRTTGDDASGASIILAFPAGLVKMNDEGEPRSYSVRILVERRLAGTSAWQTVQTIDMRAKKTEAFFRQFSWSFPTRGRWDVRLTRLTTESTNSAVSDRASWAALQTFRPEYPINFAPAQTLVAMRIKATHQLNGGLDNFSALAAAVCLDWDAASGEWVARPTSNPASLYRHVLQSQANPRPVGDAGIDLDQLADWHDFCSANALTYDEVLDQTGTTLREVLTRIAAAGRATPRHDGQKWGVVIDRPQSLIVDHISPRNSWNFRTSRSYVQPPHAFRVKFKDGSNDFDDAERLIEWPGHTGPIELTELLEVPGQTNADAVWRAGRRRQLETIHRPDTYEVMQDGAARVATRGDLVALSHDVLDDVQRAARVTLVVGDRLTLDEVIEAADGADYGIRFRVFASNADTIGQSVVRTVRIADGDLILTGAGEVPAPGDLILFGRASIETRQMRVTGVEMAEDMACMIRLIDAAPEIDAELATMVPPPWTGRVGWIPAANSEPPPVPRFTAITTGRAAEIDFGGDLYGSDAATTISFALIPGPGAVQTIGYRISHRLLGATSWQVFDLPAADGGGSITGYAVGERVQFKSQGIGLAGQIGAATAIMAATIGSGDPAVPGAIEVDGVTVTVLPGGVRIAVDVLDAATTQLQLYHATSATLNRATDASGPPVPAQAGRTAVLYAGDATRRNLAPDPGMDGGAGWSRGTGWSIGGGVATHTPPGGYALGAAVPLITGRSYRVAYDLTISAGNIRPRLNGDVITAGTMRTTSGRWSDTLIANAQNRIEFLASSSASASIDNVLVYQPTAACLPPGTHYFWAEPLNADGTAGPVIGPFSAIIE